MKKLLKEEVLHEVRNDAEMPEPVRRALEILIESGTSFVLTALDRNSAPAIYTFGHQKATDHLYGGLAEKILELAEADTLSAEVIE